MVLLLKKIYFKNVKNSVTVPKSKNQGYHYRYFLDADTVRAYLSKSTPTNAQSKNE